MHVISNKIKNQYFARCWNSKNVFFRFLVLRYSFQMQKWIWEPSSFADLHHGQKLQRTSRSLTWSGDLWFIYFKKYATIARAQLCIVNLQLNLSSDHLSTKSEHHEIPPQSGTQRRNMQWGYPPLHIPSLGTLFRRWNDVIFDSYFLYLFSENVLILK